MSAVEGKSGDGGLMGSQDNYLDRSAATKTATRPATSTNVSRYLTPHQPNQRLYSKANR
jgi:hypothetical protein